jgi:hypothetical protein
MTDIIKYSPNDKLNKNNNPFPNININYIGYIDNGYTLNSNGMCNGNLITQKYDDITGYQTITKQVTLIAVENKLSYNLISINNPQQILIMSKDNKYIFPFGDGSFGTNDMKESFLTLVTIIFAIKKYNISIPLYNNLYLLTIAANNPNYNPYDLDTPESTDTIPLIKMIKLANKPDTDPLNSLDSTNIKIWSDLSGYINTFYQLYSFDLSNMCISISSTNLNNIPKNVIQYDCRKTTIMPTNSLPDNPLQTNSLLNTLLLDNLQKNNSSSDNSSSDNSLFGRYTSLIIIGFISLIILIIILYFFNSKPKKLPRGGYYYPSDFV